MSKSIFGGGFLVIFFLLTTPPASMIKAQNQTEENESKQCCFTNPKYAGVCEVDPAEGETCASILGYLNNPQSAGKTYCNNTRLRSGWKQVACEEDEGGESTGQD